MKEKSSNTHSDGGRIIVNDKIWGLAYAPRNAGLKVRYDFHPPMKGDKLRLRQDVTVRRSIELSIEAANLGTGEFSKQAGLGETQLPDQLFKIRVRYRPVVYAASNDS